VIEGHIALDKENRQETRNKDPLRIIHKCGAEPSPEHEKTGQNKEHGDAVYKDRFQEELRKVGAMEIEGVCADHKKTRDDAEQVYGQVTWLCMEMLISLECGSCVCHETLRLCPGAAGAADGSTLYGSRQCDAFPPALPAARLKRSAVFSGRQIEVCFPGYQKVTILLYHFKEYFAKKTRSGASRPCSLHDLGSP